MSDTISRQAAIDAIERNAYRHTYIDQIVDIIKGLPSAQPERKKGKWIPSFEVQDHVECDNCHKGYDWDSCAQYYDFCPNCGADMRKGEADEG